MSEVLRFVTAKVVDFGFSGEYKKREELIFSCLFFLTVL